MQIETSIFEKGFDVLFGKIVLILLNWDQFFFPLLVKFIECVTHKHKHKNVCHRGDCCETLNFTRFFFIVWRKRVHMSYCRFFIFHSNTQSHCDPHITRLPLPYNNRMTTLYTSIFIFSRQRPLGHITVYQMTHKSKIVNKSFLWNFASNASVQDWCSGISLLISGVILDRISLEFPVWLCQDGLLSCLEDLSRHFAHAPPSTVGVGKNNYKTVDPIPRSFIWLCGTTIDMRHSVEFQFQFETALQCHKFPRTNSTFENITESLQSPVTYF